MKSGYNMKEILIRLKPGVHKKVLVYLSGLMWIGVGFMMCSLAWRWLAAYQSRLWFLFPAVGFVAAMLIHHYGFLKLASKNIARISAMTGRPCLFSFLSWKSYFLVALMITLGITLRHSPLPKQWLSIVYIGIGLALALSSIRYFRQGLRMASGPAAPF